MTPSERTVCFLDAVHPILAKRLESAGMTCLHHHQATKDSILQGAFSTCFGVVLRARVQLDVQALDAMPQLRFIARSGAGLENIDLKAAEERGVRVFNSPEGNADAVGEHAIGQMLMLLHRLRQADLSVRLGKWDREAHRGVELAGKKVGIVGFGHMGSSFAHKLSGFNCQTMAYDKYRSGFQGMHGVQEVGMEQLFEVADIISLHVPLTSETTGLVNAEWLSKFDRPILLINTSRGPVVRTVDLLDALDSETVVGAALDVLEFEGRNLEGLTDRPADFQRLIQHPRVVLSPHVAGWTVESYFKLSEFLATKILESDF